MNEWILRLDEGPAEGPRLAVKDAIDVAGTVTTVGCKGLADRGEIATADAECVTNARAFGARIVGKTNLHELCFGTTGANPTFGDPVNPKWPDLIPGGSSSGSAVAVANGEADVALGTDTGGSVRLPATCCGIAGLKTTLGRVSTKGLWPLAPSLDTVGPIARDVAGLVLGMQMLEPGFSVAGASPATVIGRVASPVPVDPELEDVVDRTLRGAERNVEPVELEGWDRGSRAFAAVIGYEAWQSDKELMESGGVHDYVGERLRGCSFITHEAYEEARTEQKVWADEVERLLQRVPVLAMAMLESPPPAVGAAFLQNSLAYPWNMAGLPALALSLPGKPGSAIQLIGPRGGEELLLATAAVIEASVNY